MGNSNANEAGGRAFGAALAGMILAIPTGGTSLVFTVPYATTQIADAVHLASKGNKGTNDDFIGGLLPGAVKATKGSFPGIEK
ncbi:hypothetical protein ABK040_007367 [Willaertia magna]